MTLKTPPPTTPYTPAHPAYYASIDWGTSQLRFWLFDSAGTLIIDKRTDDGMDKLTPADYCTIVEGLFVDTPANDETPLIICGMAGARTGWQEAPYLETPTSVLELARAAMPITADKAKMGRDIRIIPGVAYGSPQSPDVMRGEETLLYGAGLISPLSGTICLPGTHSKWVRLDDGKITSFNTVMTGELYHLLSRQSTLSHAPDVGMDGGEVSFLEGVRFAKNKPEHVVNQLFKIRASHLLFPNHIMANHNYLSGVLIGAEIIANSVAGSSVTLVASGDLATRYRQAIAECQLSCDTIDSEQVAQMALFDIAQKIWG